MIEINLPIFDGQTRENGDSCQFVVAKEIVKRRLCELVTPGVSEDY